MSSILIDILVAAKEISILNLSLKKNPKGHNQQKALEYLHLRFLEIFFWYFIFLLVIRNVIIADITTAQAAAAITTATFMPTLVFPFSESIITITIK